jgi:hypothetical protein
VEAAHDQVERIQGERPVDLLDRFSRALREREKV